MSTRGNIARTKKSERKSYKDMAFYITKARLLFFVKWMAFIVCSVGFAWKMSDSFISYWSKEIGTKIMLKGNQEISLPGIAVCRHPNQVARPVSPHDDNSSLWNEYGLKLANLRFTTAYEKLNGTIDDGFDEFLFNDTKSIRGVTISSLGRYARVASADFQSRSADNWSSFFHPTFGVCYSFRPGKPVSEIVGSSGIAYVKVSIDFTKAFPDFIDDDDQDNNKKHPELRDLENSYGANEVLIMAFDPGSFATSFQTAVLKKSNDEEFTLKQEIIDRSATRAIFNCHDYTMIGADTEDDCLNECLVKTFVGEFGCLHYRLSKLAIQNETLASTRPCHLDDLERRKATLAALESAQDRRGSPNKRRRAPEEIGLVRIREILAAFNQEEDLGARCGCKMKCIQRVITIMKWPSERTVVRDKRYQHNFLKFGVNIFFSDSIS